MYISVVVLRFLCDGILWVWFGGIFDVFLELSSFRGSFSIFLKVVFEIYLNFFGFRFFLVLVTIKRNGCFNWM